MAFSSYSSHVMVHLISLSTSPPARGGARAARGARERPVQLHGGGAVYITLSLLMDNTVSTLNIAFVPL